MGRPVIVVAVLVLLAACFAPVLCQDRVIAFRDAANYYYPLFQWQCYEWGQGRLPLWNPYDATGTPSFAETTSSVLYPGKLVFALPIAFETRYSVYIIAHVLLAVGAAYSTARCWGSSREAAGICGVSYGFAGVVLFQCHNVVFLVGAAWLPVALLAAEQAITRGRQRAALGLGVVLALMTLGGDPQAAYHAGLAAVGCACLLPDGHGGGRARRLLANSKLIALALTVGLLLAAVQIWPALEWAQRSERASYDRPRNLYEAVATASDTDPQHPVSGLLANLRGLCRAPQPGSHYANCFDYSVAPWQFAELVWPRCFGDLAPVNRRWDTALPASQQVWTPSIYFGILPLLLALRSCRWWRGPARTRWLSWLMAWFAIASCGWYGVGWVAREVYAGLGDQAGAETFIGPSVGGLHWWMTILLPGYGYFRYPAKLLVVASLCGSLLAAHGWDELFSKGSQRLQVPAGWALGLSVLVMVAYRIVYPRWVEWVATAPADPIFGPLEATTAGHALLGGLVHTTIVGAALIGAVRVSGSDRIRKLMLLVIVVLDLAVAQRSLVVSVSAAQLRQQPNLRTQVDDRWRVFRGRVARPTQWSLFSDPNRLEDVVRWERASLHPKHHLAQRVGLVESVGTFSSSAMKAVSRLRSQQQQEFDLYRFFSAKYELRAADSGLDRSKIEHASFDLVERVGVLPRAWLVGHVVYQPPAGPMRRRQLDEQTRKVFLEEGSWRDLLSTAVVEGVSELPDRKGVGSRRADPLATCQIERTDPQQIEINVQNQQLALLVVNDLFYPGWRAQIRSDGGPWYSRPILRTNRVMRGVWLPAGRHRVRMDYRPASFYRGAALSSLGLLVLLLALVKSGNWPWRPIRLAALRASATGATR